MIVRLSLVVAIALMVQPLLAQQSPPPPRVGAGSAPAGAAGGGGELKSVRDKASYSFGMMIGKNLKRQGVDVDLKLFIQGLNDATTTGKVLLTDAQANEAVQAFEKEVAAKKTQESKDFLVQNKKRPGVEATASGLQYKVVQAGKGPKPTAKDAVVVVYRGMFINGEEFDSSAGKEFTIGVADVIPGWQEALQLMPVGSKWRLYIPSELAYGEQGQPPIPPNTTLVFDIELKSIAKAPPAGASKAPPKFE
jgi:FKBP-type peptidyl-prolyl cis-trans isomerase